MFRAMLSPRPDHTPPAPAELLNLIAKALVAATADTGDDMTLEDVLNDFVEAEPQSPFQRNRPGLTAHH